MSSLWLFQKTFLTLKPLSSYVTMTVIVYIVSEIVEMPMPCLSPAVAFFQFQESVILTSESESPVGVIIEMVSGNIPSAVTVLISLTSSTSPGTHMQNQPSSFSNTAYFHFRGAWLSRPKLSTNISRKQCAWQCAGV